MRFQGLDLNLLVVLDALLSERSVSLAAERVNLSQSATSSALGRLRHYFSDDLLVLRGCNMVLTSRGEELVEPVRAVLEQIRSTIAIAPEFNPANAVRTFSIMASDYSTEVLLAPLLPKLARVAPGVRIEIQPLHDAPVEALERGQTDLLLTIDYAISAEHPREILFEEDYVVLGWKDNPAMAEPMTRDLYFELGHVTARFGKARVPAFEDWFMRRQKQQRRVEVVAPSFLSLPGLVLGSDRIATCHRRHAEKVCTYLPLVMRELPMAIPPLREALQWHISNSNDTALRWLVELIKLEASADVDGASDALPNFQDRRGDHGEHDQIAEQFLAALASPKH